MTNATACRLDRSRHCTAMARDLFTFADADGSAVDQARVAILLDTASARLPETTEPGGDAEQRAHVVARLLQHAGRLLAELRFADWDMGETIAALVSAAAAELDAACRALEQEARVSTLASAA